MKRVPGVPKRPTISWREKAVAGASREDYSNKKLSQSGPEVSRYRRRMGKIGIHPREHEDHEALDSLQTASERTLRALRGER